MKPVHGGAHAYKRRIALGTRQRRFDLKERAREREREREKAGEEEGVEGWEGEGLLRLNGGEHACNVYRSNARHDMSVGGKDCGGWFAGRLHNAILRHNDCNGLMHFRTVHWVADWRCFESLFSRLHESGLTCILSISLSLYALDYTRIYPCLNNALKSIVAYSSIETISIISWNIV